ncbi:MAG: hypothetical protein K9K66_14715 [Desulfarculaceae bacterium]|nr:hypothetical protein [Desulfarculaceae bacterium]MCF8072444.1 hypothetical protein [Desulfarculaceae bacterium]MCF8102905.1 hypothetical protein [Desulfarculaceae bacterium]MCF8118487.1 hypothetical protein [Desulfarculaceae bacterium]
MDQKQQNQAWASLRQPSSTWVTKLLINRLEPQPRPAPSPCRSRRERESRETVAPAMPCRPRPGAGLIPAAQATC